MRLKSNLLLVLCTLWVMSVEAAENCKHCDSSQNIARNIELLSARLTETDSKKVRLEGFIFVDGAGCSSIAELEGTNIVDNTFTNTNFKGANLPFANLEGFDLRNSNFEGANLMRANLMGAKIDGASFKGASLSKVIWTDGSVCKLGSVGSCLK